MFGSREGLISKIAFLICLIGISCSSQVIADTQQIVDYQFDSAGNIIGVRAGQNLAPPEVTNLSPPFVNKENFAFVTATGTNLYQATVSLNTAGVTLVDVTNVSDSELKFTLFADDTAITGNVPVTFTTRLGSDVENLAVAERTPVVSTNPNPIILSPNSQTVDVLLTFDQPFAADQVFDVAITDETIASISNQQVTLLTGETEVSTTVTGLVAGSTTLEINQLSNFLALGIPVVVTEDKLPAGNYSFYSKPIAVTAYTEPALNTTGVFVTQRPLGVAAYIEPSINVNGIFATQRPLGVSTYIQPSINVNGIFATQVPLATTYGTNIEQTSPAIVNRNTSATLTIDGIELDSVSAVSFSPSDGITQTAAFTVTPDGLQMTVSINISGTASTGARAVILTTPAGDQLFSKGIFNVQ